MANLSDPKPTNLHISHSWGGGVDRWVRDFCQHDRQSENLVLENLGTFHCYGIGLRLLAGRSRRELGRWLLKRPIGETLVSHPEYREILEGICEGHGVSHIMLSCLVGHSLDVFDVGLPVTKIHHDYYPYCPNIYVFYDRPCFGCNEDEMADCLSNNPVDFANNKCSVSYWLDLREAYLEALRGSRVLNVCPTPGMVDHLLGLHPGWREVDFSVVPHGTRLTKGDSFGGAEDGRRLRVAILGTQHIVKGIEILKETFDEVRLLADLTFLGGGPDGLDFARRFGVRYLERFDHSRLEAILDDGAFDLAAFTSTFPETFCYTLSEVRARSIPPCARSIGSFLDRIDDGKDGFLLGTDSADLVDFLVKVNANRDLLREVASNLRQRPVRSVEEMVENHYQARAERWSSDRSAEDEAVSGPEEPRTGDLRRSEVRSAPEEVDA